MTDVLELDTKTDKEIKRIDREIVDQELRIRRAKKRIQELTTDKIRVINKAVEERKRKNTKQ